MRRDIYHTTSYGKKGTTKVATTPSAHTSRTTMSSGRYHSVSFCSRDQDRVTNGVRVVNRVCRMYVIEGWESNSKCRGEGSLSANTTTTLWIKKQCEQPGWLLQSRVAAFLVIFQAFDVSSTRPFGQGGSRQGQSVLMPF